VIGRIVSRVWVIGIWGWDDTLIIFAFMNSVLLSVFFSYATRYGQGYHVENVPHDLVVTSFSITYVTLICYQLALCLTKLSILVFYLRVFPARREKLLSWGTIIFIFLAITPILIADILQCNPATGASFFTDSMMCLQPTPVLVASTVVHTILDGWLIIMVIPVVVTLQIPRRQKIALIGVLSLGVLVIIASAARISSLLNDDTNTDFTWVTADFDIWTVLEVSIGIICACAPAIRPLIQKAFPKLLATVLSGNRTMRTAVEREMDRPVSAIELGTRHAGSDDIEAGEEASNKKDSWLSDGLNEEHLILKQGMTVRKTDTMVTDRLYGLGELRNTRDLGGWSDTSHMGEDMSFNQGKAGATGRPP
jgi:hypothetical protein